jgi:hypothetical protein
VSGYVQVQRSRGKTYFYLRPPPHLRLGFTSLKLDAATAEEAERMAAGIIEDALAGDSTIANIDMFMLEEQDAPEFCDRQGCRNRPDFVVGANADLYLCRVCINHPEYSRFRLPPSPLPHFVVEQRALEQQGETDRLTRRREVPLRGRYRDRVAYVDAGDLDLVMQYRWRGMSGGAANEWGKLIYARTDFRADGTLQYLLMHRLILGQPNDLGTDHLDGNGLNNQRYNLRPATAVENNLNRKPHRNIRRRQTGHERDAIDRASEMLRRTGRT